MGLYAISVSFSTTDKVYDISKNLYINSMQILIKKIQAESLKLCFLRIKSNLNNRQ